MLDPLEHRQRLWIYSLMSCATRRNMLVQNQTTFSASHVQAYWAHLDHVVYKNEVSRLWLRSSLCSKEHYLLLAKEQQGWLMRGALTDGRHRMEARSRSSHRPQSPCSLLRCITEKRLRNTTPPELDGSVPNAELESELDEPVTNP